MDQSTHDVRRANWLNIVNQCQGRPVGMSVKQCEYYGAAGSSSIIRKWPLLDISILPQVTAYRIFHTLFALSFLIDCLFLLQNRCCNHMLLHSQQHLNHDLIHLQNSVKLLFRSCCIFQQ